MILVLMAALTVLLFIPAHSYSTTTDNFYEPLNLNYVPSEKQGIKKGETHIFRAPLCIDREGGQADIINGWKMQVKVYVEFPKWDGSPTGDGNYLEIRVSNVPDFKQIVAHNLHEAEGDDSDIQPYVEYFGYYKETWGANAVYIAITASDKGEDQYIWGVELSVEYADNFLPDGMDTIKEDDPIIYEEESINAMDQIAVPQQATLNKPGQYGNFVFPVCFEDKYKKRIIHIGAYVPVEPDGLPGGVSIWFCNANEVSEDDDKMVCHSMQSEFFENNGAMVASVTPTIDNKDFGAAYLRVRSSGDYDLPIEMIVYMKLKDKEANETIPAVPCVDWTSFLCDDATGCSYGCHAEYNQCWKECSDDCTNSSDWCFQDMQCSADSDCNFNDDCAGICS